jgi:glycosyltransferase involved in cell wall biosynthesis
MRNSLSGLKRLVGQRDNTPFGLVFHHHGTRFRSAHHEVWLEGQRAGALQVASTIDLTILEDGVEWLPSPFDIAYLMSLRMSALKTKPEHAPFRVAHAPTDRTKKSTAALMDAILELNRRGIPTVLDLIERRPNDYCLARKAKADVYFDQLHLGYGNNAVEAWGMVVPVVAGVDDGPVAEAMLDRWGGLPFYRATESTIAARLAELATDKELRDYWAAIGYKHALTYHDSQVVAARLAGYYNTAMEHNRSIVERHSVRAIL